MFLVSPRGGPAGRRRREDVVPVRPNAGGGFPEGSVPVRHPDGQDAAGQGEGLEARPPTWLLVQTTLLEVEAEEEEEEEEMAARVCIS